MQDNVINNVELFLSFLDVDYLCGSCHCLQSRHCLQSITAFQSILYSLFSSFIHSFCLSNTYQFRMVVYSSDGVINISHPPVCLSSRDLPFAIQSIFEVPFDRFMWCKYRVTGSCNTRYPP
eukprot:410577_1